MEAVRDKANCVDVLGKIMPGEIHGIVVHGEHAFYAVQLLQLLNLRAVQVDPIAGFCFAGDGQTDDAVRRRIWIGIHQRGVDHAEDCSRRADAQRQRDYSRYCEPEVPDELACCVTEILKQGLHGPFLAAQLMQSMFAYPTQAAATDATSTERYPKISRLAVLLPTVEDNCGRCV